MKSFRMGIVALMAVAGTAPGVMAQQGEQQANQLLSFERRQGYVLLFDGQTLEHFTPDGTGEWKVVDGTIVPPAGGSDSQLVTNRSFGNFHFEIDFLADANAKSAVFLRVPEGEKGTAENSFEVRISDSDPEWPTGSIVNVAKATQNVPTVGAWHNLDILSIGGVITIMIDETTVADLDIPPKASIGRIHIAPTAEGNIQFRNVRILPM